MKYVVICSNTDCEEVVLITSSYKKANKKAEAITFEDYGQYGYVSSYTSEIPTEKLVMQENENE